jgi:hypothetical protein
MIIGSILETSIDNAAQTSGMNGNSLLLFNTTNDAVEWAIAQSQRIVYGSTGQVINALTMVINTKTNSRRWWFGGTEYTG